MVISARLTAQRLYEATMNTMKKLPLATAHVFSMVCVAVAFLVFMPSALAQTTYYWRSETANGGSGSWSGSWHWWRGYEEVPTGREILVFDNNAQTSMTNDLTNTERHRIVFEDGATTGRTINGSTANTFWDVNGNAARIRNESSANHTINFGITSASGLGLELDANSGTLTLGGTVTATGANRTIKTLGGGTVAISGNVNNGNDSGVVRVLSLQKDGAGTLSLTGAGSTFSGGITVNGGILATNSNAALGATSGIVTLNDTATFNNTAAMGSIARVFAVTDAANATVTFNTGGDLSFSSTGSQGIAGGSSTATLIKTGSGTLNLTNNKQAVSGTWRISQGVLHTSNDGGLGNDANDITLNGGTFRYGGSTGSSLTLGSGRVITANNVTGNVITTSGGTLILGTANQLTGAGAVTFNNSGAVLQLNASNNYSGTLTQSSGTTLILGADDALGTGTLLISPGTSGNVATVRASDTTARSLANTNVSITSGSGVAVFGDTAGTPVGTGDLTFGSLTLSGGDRYVSVSNSGATVTFSGVGTDATTNRALIKQGAGTLAISGASSYTGQTIIDAGTIKLGNNTAAGSNTVFIGSGNTAFGNTDAAVLLGSSGLTVANNLWTNKADTGTGVGTGARTIGGSFTSGASTFSGQLQVNGPTTLTAADGGRVNFSGNIINGTDTSANVARNIVVSGAGTIALSGSNNTYSGGTSVTNGALIVNGGAAGTNPTSGTGSGDVTVSGTGSLMGIGRISGKVGLSDTASISGGNGVGQIGNLSTGALTLTSTNKFIADIASASSYDQILANGVTLGGSLLDLNIPTGTTFTQGQTLLLLTNQSANPISGTFSNAPADGGTYTLDGYSFVADYTYLDSNDFALVAVPEPSTWAAGVLAVAALGFTQRRRLRGLVGRSV